MKKIPANTLRKIETDIQCEDLGKARDRLLGLISTYPNELELRKRLGDIYYELRYPVMAGRYWYLEKNKTPEMLKACNEFEKSMGNDPVRIARVIKYKGDLRLLQNQGLSVDFAYLKNTAYKVPEEPIKDALFLIGFIIILVLFVLFTGIGVYTCFHWIF